MKLAEAIALLSTLPPDDLICARKPWTAQSEVLVVTPTTELGVPDHVRAAGFDYFLEVSTAQEAMAVFHGGVPTADEILDMLVYYAEHDAYPEWVFERFPSPPAKRYFKGAWESELCAAEVYIEYTHTWPTRQVEVCGDTWLWGDEAHPTYLADQPLDSVDMDQVRDVSEAEFEHVWQEALRRRPRSSVSDEPPPIPSCETIAMLAAFSSPMRLAVEGDERRCQRNWCVRLARPLTDPGLLSQMSAELTGLARARLGESVAARGLAALDASTSPTVRLVPIDSLHLIVHLEHARQEDDAAEAWLVVSSAALRGLCDLMEVDDIQGFPRRYWRPLVD